jgi:hypothetical protein
MAKNGYTPEFAEKTFSRLEGFGSYGFPENHAVHSRVEDFQPPHCATSSTLATKSSRRSSS